MKNTKRQAETTLNRKQICNASLQAQEPARRMRQLSRIAKADRGRLLAKREMLKAKCVIGERSCS